MLCCHQTLREEIADSEGGSDTSGIIIAGTGYVGALEGARDSGGTGKGMRLMNPFDPHGFQSHGSFRL